MIRINSETVFYKKITIVPAATSWSNHVITLNACTDPVTMEIVPLPSVCVWGVPFSNHTQLPAQYEIFNNVDKIYLITCVRKTHTQ